MKKEPASVPLDTFFDDEAMSASEIEEVELDEGDSLNDLSVYFQHP